MHGNEAIAGAAEVAASLAHRCAFLILGELPGSSSVCLARAQVGAVAEAIPALREDVVVIQREGVCAFEAVIGQPFARRIAAPGALHIIPRGLPSSWAASGSVGQVYLWLGPTFLPTVASEACDRDPDRATLIPCAAASDPLACQLGLMLFAEAQAGPCANRLYAESLVHTLGVHLLCKHAGGAPLPERCQGGLGRAALQRVLDYIEDHLACDLTLAELAGLTGYSVFHFTRLFKHTTGRSVHAYITERRVEAARCLLSSGEFSVAEAAAVVGFHDQSHLGRHFKQRYGISPGALVKQRTNVPRERTNLQAEGE